MSHELFNQNTSAKDPLIFHFYSYSWFANNTDGLDRGDTVCLKSDFSKS